MFPFPYEPDYRVFENVGPAAVDATRREYGLATGRRYLIYCGRLVAVKRVDLLVEAFCRIAERRPEWSVIIAGDGALREALHEIIPKPLADRFIWTGFVDNSAVLASLYKCADVLVLPSDVEPWGVVVTEAAAGSLALVCSAAVGAAREVVRNGVNGRVFSTGDVAALTDVLSDVTDAGNIERMKAASPNVLADWRRRGDPVKGLREALCFAGVVSVPEPVRERC
jgi:glycosyltransferase involved in cell wall biosynthesis